MFPSFTRLCDNIEWSDRRFRLVDWVRTILYKRSRRWVSGGLDTILFSILYSNRCCTYTPNYKTILDLTH